VFFLDWRHFAMVLPKSQSTRSKLTTTPRPAKKTKPVDEPTRQTEKVRWTFLTNHAHVLILLSQDSSLVLREVALRIGITERAVQRIIADLEHDGFIEREKVGRRNHYRILTKRPLRHPVESHRSIGDLIALIGTKR
jgi:predicted DNA-binding transcriptional regulator